MRYELTDYEWAAVRPFLPNKPCGVPRVNDRRVPQWNLLGLAIRRAMARSAGDIWPIHDLLQSFRALGESWRLGPDNGRTDRNS
jgi:transposase